ncbi:unnamed protein product [Caenorhabditis auriculariae]|uniref:Uncharacterized protein n=1 Tax=Caenorhabditis auriculariae TaxID=2777116 RepID=A0A8S1HVG4_9PELO|nr:unnamed protein product [Caenorhabditis auriculariae]
MKSVSLAILAILALAAFSEVSAGIDLTTCARMNVPILSKGARALCIASCNLQNCGTGYCKKRSGRPTCMCSRCANGGQEIPLKG